jgi:hypothetical protein
MRVSRGAVTGVLSCVNKNAVMLLRCSITILNLAVAKQQNASEDFKFRILTRVEKKDSHYQLHRGTSCPVSCIAHPATPHPVSCSGF